MVMKKRQYEFLGLVSLAVLAFVFGSFISGDIGGSDSQSASLNYQGHVCVYKNGELVECSHNLLYSNGKNITRDLLGVGLSAPVLNISLCNATAECEVPVAAGSESYSALVGCGLSNVQGTYNTISAYPGNWTITKTFTSTCDAVNINSTRLTNGTGSIFAGNTFTLVTLQTNDQLTINWSLMIS